MSNNVHLDEISYRPDGCALFECIRTLPGAAFLDSSQPYASSGRYDILTAEPCETSVPAIAHNASELQCRQFFQQLGDFHADRYAGIRPAAQDIPFCGGVLGYIGYDCGDALNRVFDGAPALRRLESAHTEMPPAVQLRAYDWCVVQDHLLRRAVLVTLPAVTASRRADLQARLSRHVDLGGVEFSLTSAFSSNFSAQEYRSAFERIQAYIEAGDCYQVNLAQRFTASCEGQPWRAYRLLRKLAAAPFAAYLGLGDDDAIISLSPERFIALHGHHVEASPIKGTRPRHTDPLRDQQAARELRDSEKDRAENLMIVDLLRNDLGRSCVPGSIHVDRLFELHSYPTVHHLVSTISGELRADRGPAELLRDSFPGGSITGAPKRRAMEIIAELEPHARQMYCGSVLYLSADGRMDSNIAIRTLLCHRSRIHCWGGGGIVADSDCQREYEEIHDKVGTFLSALEATRNN